jgi:hypothetical protein
MILNVSHVNLNHNFLCSHVLGKCLGLTCDLRLHGLDQGLGFRNLCVRFLALFRQLVQGSLLFLLKAQWLRDRQDEPLRCNFRFLANLDQLQKVISTRHLFDHVQPADRLTH